MSGLRWSEDQPQVHLNAHRNKVGLSCERFKQKKQARVHEARKSAVNVKSEQNTVGTENAYRGAA